jgi:ParB family transcriptional regulator, chromosome partitioning protein
MSKNRNLLSGIADRVNRGSVEEPTVQTPPVETSTGPFAANLAGITNPRAPGQAESKIQKTAVQRQVWIDPSLCRVWAHHNRAYDLLNDERCADLISGFRTLGRQQRPAIVRTLKGDARLDESGNTHDFEIISGARRHWTVSWLREKGETNAQGEPYLFLVVVRDDLDVTDAFELSDAENRGQKDISDFERAREYRWALDNLYESNISRMAEAIQMDRSHLSRLLALTEMPEEIVLAYPSILDIRTHHWRQLSSYFSSKEREKVAAAERALACARSIVQARENHSRNIPTDGAQTLSLLLAALKEKKRGGDRTQILKTVTAKATGKIALKVKRTTRGMTFEIPRASGASKEEIHDAFGRAIDEYFEV